MRRQTIHWNNPQLVLLTLTGAPVDARLRWQGIETITTYLEEKTTTNASQRFYQVWGKEAICSRFITYSGQGI